MESAAAIEILLSELRRLRAEGVDSVSLGPEAEARLAELLGRAGGPVARAPAASAAASRTAPAASAPTASPRPSPATVPPSGPRPAPRAAEPLPPPPAVEIPAEGSKSERLAALRERVRACPECRRRAGAGRAPFAGWGAAEADLLLVGDHPGEEESATGDPFAGPAGELLGKALKAMGVDRGRVYVTHVLRWRPLMAGGQGTRPAAPDEVAFCLPYLRAEIALLAPRVIVALGKGPLNALAGAGDELSITRERGAWREALGAPLLPTYLPSYLLRNPSPKVKREFWEDMLAVTERLGLPVTERQRGFYR